MSSSPLSLSLRPSPSNEAASSEQLTLAHLLARITAEYGPNFANVTEEKLLAQINRLPENELEMENGAQLDVSGKTMSREELVKTVQVAVEESSLAQDFISLLLSSMRPAAGSASMSPALRNAVPTGALGGGRIAAPPQKADTVLCAGWRKSELDKASQTLIAAAERVGRKQGAITGFVEGVSKVRSGGWGIVQMPAPSGETGGFKVFYGFQKAGSDYHDPGFGFLREGSTGDLVFDKDPKFADKPEKQLRIRLEQNADISSSITGPRDYSEKGLSQVETQLYKARDAVFDDELYHELTKEARVLSNSGVLINETEIHVPLPNGSKILIDLINPEEIEGSDGETLPNLILQSLRALLSHAHHVNLKKRQEIPEPLNPRKPQLRPMILLRPILAFATHSNLLHLAETYFNSLLEPFKSAHLPCSLSISRFSNLSFPSSLSSPPSLVETLLSTTRSTLTLYLPGDSSLSLQIQTPYQHSQATYTWQAPFILKTTCRSAPDGEIQFDALNDAESPIMLAVEESLADATKEILGEGWRKVELREFEKKGRRIRIEIRSFDHAGRIVVVNGEEEIECTDKSLQTVLEDILKT